MTDRLKILLSPLFIFFLLLLLLNDFFLKGIFHNEITGKLSDISGLFIFPIFWSAIFPKQKKWIFLLTGFGFTIWKSPYVSGFIELLGPYLGIERTVDLSDLLALPMILCAWFYMKNGVQAPRKLALLNSLRVYVVGAVAIFSFCATTQRRYIMDFDQPHYVLLKDPVLHQLRGYGEFDLFIRDSLLLAKINFMDIPKPVRQDDYHKNLSIKELDREVLLSIADSASLIPTGKITLMSIMSNGALDSLRFNGGRLDGRFVRMKDGKRIIEGFYKMGLEDSIWTMIDTTDNEKIVKTFVNGETVNIKRYQQDKLRSSSNLNTRSDTIFLTYMQLAVLILGIGGLGFWIYRNYRLTAPTSLQLKLSWKWLMCLVMPFFVWLTYFGIRLLLMNDDQDSFERLANILFIFIAVCPLMFVVVFWIKLRRRVDLLLYGLLFALACAAWTTYVLLQQLSI